MIPIPLVVLILIFNFTPLPLLRMLAGGLRRAGEGLGANARQINKGEGETGENHVVATVPPAVTVAT